MADGPRLVEWSAPSDINKGHKEEVFVKNNARFTVIGDFGRLPQIVQDALAHLIEVTKNNTNTCMVLALSYSSKWELTKAMKDIAAEVEAGKIKSTDITEETINQHLETKDMPEPELMIRTGGELRLSNYLLWQCAYSEFYFTDVYWPDFTIEEFRKAIADYQGRQRRYGKTGEQIVEETSK